MCKPFIIILLAAILATPLQNIKGHEVDTIPHISIKNTFEPLTVSTAAIADIATDTVVPVKAVTAPVVGTNAAMQFIFQHESSGRLDAVNEIGACGLGQSLPCSKLSSVCPGWRTDADCQIQFFTSYAVNRYGSWENAHSFWLTNRWW